MKKHTVPRHTRKARGKKGRVKVKAYTRKTRKLGKTKKPIKTRLHIKKGGRITRFNIMKDKNGLFVGVRKKLK